MYTSSDTGLEGPLFESDSNEHGGGQNGATIWVTSMAIIKVRPVAPWADTASTGKP